MSIPADIQHGEATVTATCKDCGVRYKRRTRASRAKWCPKCAQVRRDEAVIRWNTTRRAKESEANKVERAQLAGVRKSDPLFATSRSPENYVPGPERIAEIEGRCGICMATYWTLNAAKRAAGVCDRCAK